LSIFANPSASGVLSPSVTLQGPEGNPEVSGYEEVDRDEKGIGEGFVPLLNIVSRKMSPKGLWVKL